MIAILRDKNQITLPKKIIQAINLKTNSNLDVTLNRKGQIIITPVALIEKALIDELKEALNDVKKGNVSKAMSADDIIKKLGI